MTTTLPRREEIPTAYTWDVDSIFASASEWESAYQELEGALEELTAFRGRLGSSAASLLNWFQTYEQLGKKMAKIYVYAALLFDTNTLNQTYAALISRVYGLRARFQATCAFAEPELLSLDTKLIDQFMNDEPKLHIYRHYFDNLARKRAYVRSAEVEEVLAQASDPLTTPWSVYQVLTDGDLSFEPAHTSDGREVAVAQGTILDLIASPDRTLRRTAWESYSDGFLRVGNTLGALLAGNIKTNVFIARARGYANSLEAALYNQNIPLSVYENVIDACRRHLPLWHRYWEIRRRALGIEKLKTFDVFAPLSDQEPPLSYEQSVDLICAGMAPLGDEYVSTMRAGLTHQRWVDIYPNHGKRSGAYSSGSYDTHPFILMSYSDGLQSMSTLAHELGHSMHTYLSNKHQPFIYSRYSMFAAEVASNFNQAMVRSHLLAQELDRNFLIALIEEAMINFHRYFFIMPILSQFELRMYQRVEQRQAITATEMSRVMADLLREGYGAAGEIDEARDGITWATFPHMYMNFYVFQYASGIAAANALADGVFSGEPGAAERYLDFLKSGGSRYPLDALRLAGIDMASPEPMNRAFQVLERFIDKLDQLLSDQHKTAGA